MAVKCRAEHVGSLLRPPALLEARAAHKRGEISDEELRAREDEAALAALELQRSVGLQIFTDGEVRRATWMAGLLEQLGGVVPVEAPKHIWHRDDGEPPEDETDFEMVAARDKLYRKKTLTLAEAEFLLRHSPGQFKITMMSASMGPMLWHKDVSPPTYPTPADMMRDLVPLQIKEIEELIELGVTWIQLDSLGYNRVIDRRFEAAIGGTDSEKARQTHLERTVAVDAELVRAAKRKNPDVTVGMHICRGNNRSAWMSEGGYDPIAEKLLGSTGSCSSTTPSAPVASSRSASCRRAPRSCSASSRPRPPCSSPRTTCCAGSRRRRGTSTPSTWRSARSAASRPPRSATCSPSTTSAASSSSWSPRPSAPGAERAPRRTGPEAVFLRRRGLRALSCATAR
jgi:5-methyltetrahydropteroyltriglutamate--homocysteine methyltransferase